MNTIKFSDQTEESAEDKHPQEKYRNRVIQVRQLLKDILLSGKAD
jgi:hypothetical protein